MRTLPPALAAHLSGDVTTLCHAWRLTRRDAVAFGFTDHDRDLVFDGTTFRASTGFDSSEAETDLGLASTGSDVAGAFSDDAITNKDLKDGRYDGATVEVFLVNWQSPDQFLHLRTQEIGEVKTNGNAFTAELRSLASRLEQVQGRVYTRRCDAVLGDARCGVDLTASAFRGAGVVVSAEDTDSCLASGLAAFSDHWFRFGLVRWTSGDNAGLTSEVEDQTTDADATLLSFWAPLPNLPKAGDMFDITAGCAKTFAVCGEKFANRLNFRGFPHLPGSDFVYGYADSRTVHDGRPLVK